MIRRKEVIKLMLFTFVISLIAGVAIAGEDMTTIIGTVEQTDAGLVIKTDEGDFAAPGADLAALVGKKIEAIGKVSEGDTGKVINIESFRELQE